MAGATGLGSEMTAASESIARPAGAELLADVTAVL
jgi:hypothetical protein